MKTRTYLAMLETINASPVLRSAIPLLNSVITKCIYVIYPCLLVYLLSIQITQSDNAEDLIRSTFAAALLVPAVSFIILSIMRSAINAKRPYEVYEITPLISKSTKGRSFPSRHVFSIFIIATAFFFASPLPQIGIIIAALGVLLAMLRVVSGVHFIRDVVAGALAGIIMGYAGFALFGLA